MQRLFQVCKPALFAMASDVLNDVAEQKIQFPCRDHIPRLRTKPALMIAANLSPVSAYGVKHTHRPPLFRFGTVQKVLFRCRLGDFQVFEK